MQLPDELQYLVQSPLHQHVMQKMLDEALHRSELDDLSSDPFRRIALCVDISLRSTKYCGPT